MLWVASLYMGGLALVLALGAAGLRGVPPWRAWLTAVAVVGAAGEPRQVRRPALVGAVGPDRRRPRAARPALRPSLRDDGFLDDGAGSPYGLLATLLPGFGVFRYPSKLLTFAAVALAALAGAGWDRLVGGRGDAAAARSAGSGSGRACWGWRSALAARDRVVAFLTGRVPPDPTFGPADVAGAWSETQRALAPRRDRLRGLPGAGAMRPRGVPGSRRALALLLLTADLAVANARLVWTVPQADFEAPPEAARLIEAAERADPSPGPFRVHRMPDWYPARFRERRSPRPAPRAGRLGARDAAAAACPAAGLEYCATPGHPGDRRLPGLLRHQDDARPPPRWRGSWASRRASRCATIPRRGFDLWGARYFLLPALPDDWASRERGFASFLAETDLIYPDPPTSCARTSDRAGREPWDRARTGSSAAIGPPTRGPGSSTTPGSGPPRPTRTTVPS